MKQKIYLRIGRTNNGYKTKVDASTKAKIEPLREGTDRHSRAIPTVYMALNLTIPDEAFQPPNISASITIPLEKLGTAIEVVDPLRIL